MLKKSFFPIALIMALLAGCKGAPKAPSIGATIGPHVDPQPEGEPTIGGNIEDPNVQPTAEALNLSKVDALTAYPTLSKRQWQNVASDVFLTDVRELGESFPSETGVTIFGNDTGTQSIGDTSWILYRNAAVAIAKKITGDPASLNRLIPATAVKTEGLARAKAIVAPLLLRAYRRPAAQDEVDAMATLFVNAKKALPTANADQIGLSEVIKTVAQSPLFLYRIEIGGAPTAGASSLTAYELATRMSLAIWESIPDSELFAKAADGSLLTKAVREAQIKRMLLSPKALPVLEHFSGAVFQIRRFQSMDHATTAGWPKEINDTLRGESLAFFNQVVNVEKKGLTEFLTANYTFVNQYNAPLYGLTASGSTFTKVDLDPKKRAGYLTQVGFLASTSNDEKSGLIHRGALVNQAFFCESLGEKPSIDISKIEIDTKNKSQRQAVEASTGFCGGACHNSRINPAGSAFENYDQFGRYREKDGTFPVDAAGTFAFNAKSKFEFDNGVGFAEAMAKKFEVHRCYASKVVEYVYGRKANLSDEAIINSLSKASLDGEGTRGLFERALLDRQSTLRLSNK